MGLHGAFGKIQFAADALDGGALREECEHVLLAFGKVHGFFGARLEMRRRAGEEPDPLGFREELRRNEDAALENEINGVSEHFGVERLRDEASGPELKHAHDAFLVGKPRNHQNFEHRLHADDFFHELGAGDVGHREVKDEEISIALAIHEIKRFAGSCRSVDFRLRIAVFKHQRKCARNEGVVVNDEVLHEFSGLKSDA